MSEAILVTSIGSKLPLLRVLKSARDVYHRELKIIGADSDVTALAKEKVELFWQMPPLESIGLDGILAFSFNNNVRYIIPTRDADLLFFAHHKPALTSHGISVFVADEQSVAFCYDKLRFFEEDDSGWAIPTFSDVNAVQSTRVVVKERFGAGSENILLNAPKSEALDFSKRLNNAIFQPYIEGKEYSVDCYVDMLNVCRAAVTRSRDVIVDGESQVTTVTNDAPLARKVAVFAEKHKLQGHSVSQVIQNQEGTYLIECNARFGGASTLSEHLGMKSFLWFLCEANDQRFEVSLNPRIIRQTRVHKTDSYHEC